MDWEAVEVLVRLYDTTLSVVGLGMYKAANDNVTFKMRDTDGNWDINWVTYIYNLGNVDTRMSILLLADLTKEQYLAVLDFSYISFKNLLKVV